VTEVRHYKQALKDLEKAERLAEELTELATLLGVKADGPNAYNASKAVAKAVRGLLTLEEEAQRLGYKSPALALKALSQVKPAVELPEVFRYYPAHWVREAGVERVEVWKNGKRVDRNYKVTAVTPLQAQGRLDRLVPVLAEVLKEGESLDNHAQLSAEVVDAFNTRSYEDFVEQCFDFLRGETPYDDENEVEKVVEATDDKLEQQLEVLRRLAAETGHPFDEEATGCLLLTEG
jgi:hypothetical protein